MANLALKPNNRISFKGSGLAPISIELYKKSYAQYEKFLSERSLTEGADSVLTYLKYAKRKSVQPSTFNNLYARLKRVLQQKYKNDTATLYAIEKTFKDIKRVKLEKAITKDEYLTSEEIQDLIEKLPIKTGLFVEALFQSSLRVSALANCKLTDIKINGKATIKVVDKGGSQRTVYISLDLYNRIKREFHSRDTKYLFETSNNKKYNPNQITNQIQKHTKQLKRFCSSHTFRHSTAMYLKNEMGWGINEVADYLGHASPMTTAQYYFHDKADSSKLGFL